MQYVIDFAGFLMALIALVALLFTKKQITQTRKQISQNYNINSGLFLIKFKSFFNDGEKRKIHLKLKNNEAIADDDWATIDDYIGMFEVMYKMVQNGALALQDVKDLHAYRIREIFSNERVVIKLILEYEYWENFYHLATDILNQPLWYEFYEALKASKTFKEAKKKWPITSLSELKNGTKEIDVQLDKIIAQVKDFAKEAEDRPLMLK
jgi:hypothetical protein